VVLRNIDGGDKALNGFGTVGDGTVAEETVQDFTTAHTNVFVGLEGVSDIHFNVGRGDEFHAANLLRDENDFNEIT
jgi:hypothetical protein